MKDEHRATSLERLQRWYLSNCDDEWEHQFGVTIESLDNPGWRIIVDLEQTDRAGLPFDEIAADFENEVRWLCIKKDNAKLIGACGPLQLNELLGHILDWLENKPKR